MGHLTSLVDITCVYSNNPYRGLCPYYYYYCYYYYNYYYYYLLLFLLLNVREVFKETSINVTVQVQKHLGAVIGFRVYFKEYVSEKVSNWVNVVGTLAEFALSQPQACYSAYNFGFKHRWTYFLRTLPDIQDLLEPLENLRCSFLRLLGASVIS